MLAQSIFSAALFASAVVAHPAGILGARDLATITGVLNGIAADLTAVQTAVDAFTGAEAEAEGVQTASEKLIADLTAGAATVAATGEISLTDALGLVPTSNSLNAAANATVTALIGKKPQFDALGQTETVAASLVAQKEGSTALLEAVADKGPESIRNVAAQQGAPLYAALDAGIAAFGGAPEAPAKLRAMF
ncbi:hypothetical protein P152DRAFT_447215 [Eremomyces bilateralis CBS 781.70]|uniref:Cell wall protein n=1 Tax=Eremomyces bilateralis CBS 781.70 TaxID=1392243 RepID=A0A6G1GAQ8_9PEZI|nr:uncharacterized protein P152DRAFT_447215 [Eremomyces bilateralis CBS 781.70]KAF1814929.1 hypothetical protein P152DRAFT_447215 [Eremomyces bilateralis CBS 781.70]